MECSIDGCENLARYVSTGWCQTHYHRYWRTGTTDLRQRPLNTEIGYGAAHSRVRKFFGSASKFECFECGAPAQEWAYDGTDESARTGTVSVAGSDYPVTYSVWPEFYMPMCFPCHRALDGAARSERRELCQSGNHLWVEENIYRPPNSGPECAACKAEKGSEYHQKRKAESK